jgi:hypothetical protein
MTPRKTQRIPSSQRRRKEIKLTLDPVAHAALKGLARGEASALVSELVIDWELDQRRTRTNAMNENTEKIG